MISFLTNQTHAHNHTHNHTHNLGPKNTFFTVLLFGLLLITPIFSLSFGAADISSAEVLNWIIGSNDSETDPGRLALIEKILLEIRLPRLIMAFLAGAGLAMAGAVLQNISRNPLADPYLIGIASGASFGAVVFIASFSVASGMLQQAVSDASINGWNTVWIEKIGLTVFALVGSLLSSLIVLALAGVGAQIERMLLAGVAVNFLFSAATSLILYFSDPLAASTYLFWSLGSFSRADWGDIPITSIVVLLGFVVFLGCSRFIQALLAGDETATSLGLRPKKLRLILLMVSAAVTAIIVAHCGGIAFVGLMIPHIVRRLTGLNTGFTLIHTALLGGLFMIWVDVIARTLIDQVEMPIGIITAMVGSVFFIAVLKKRSTLQSS